MTITISLECTEYEAVLIGCLYESLQLPLEDPLAEVQDLSPFTLDALSCLADQLALVAPALEFYEGVLEKKGKTQSAAWQALVSAGAAWHNYNKEHEQTTQEKD